MHPQVATIADRLGSGDVAGDSLVVYQKMLASYGPRAATFLKDR